MNEARSELICQEFQSQVPELILADVELELHPHVASCERCRAFVEDLRLIAEETRRLFPDDP